MNATCPQCKMKFNLPPDYAGTSFKCQNCQHTFVVQADPGDPKSASGPGGPGGPGGAAAGAKPAAQQAAAPGQQPPYAPGPPPGPQPPYGGPPPYGPDPGYGYGGAPPYGQQPPLPGADLPKMMGKVFGNQTLIVIMGAVLSLMLFIAFISGLVDMPRVNAAIFFMFLAAFLFGVFVVSALIAVVNFLSQIAENTKKY
jgi:hypothetical protein